MSPTIRMVTLSELGSTRIRDLDSYWQSRRAGRLMPARADIDPADIRSLLPYLELTDLTHDPLRVYYRLVGTALVHSVGFDYTGHYLDELNFGTSDETAWERVFSEACRSRAPLFGFSRHPYDRQSAITHEFAVFPLSSDGCVVDKTINIEDYLGKPEVSDEPGWNRRGRRRSE